jgi:azurin
MLDQHEIAAVAAVTRRGFIVAALTAPVGFVGFRVLAASSRRPEVRLMIATDGDLLAFDPTELTCPSGSLVHLTFHHAGKYIRQEHDWVLTLPGTSAAVDQAGLEAGESAGYVPHGDKRVLAATALCGKGQSVTVDFVAPAPGDYPFLCTYPGHGAVMHGVLHVVPRS